jgi:hypothetical protein
VVGAGIAHISATSREKELLVKQDERRAAHRVLEARLKPHTSAVNGIPHRPGHCSCRSGGGPRAAREGITRHLGFIAVALALLIAALGPSTAVAEPQGTDRPLHGSVSGSVAGEVGQMVRGEGVGQISHLGRATMIFEGSNLPTGEPDTVSLGGAITFVSASGDELTGLFGGRAVANGPVTLTVTITGGTGRFGDASGTLTVAGSNAVTFISVNFVGTFEFQFAGEIRY